MINIRYMHNIQQSLYRIQAIDSKGHLSFKYAMALLELRNQGSITLTYKPFNSKPQVLYDLSYLHLVKILHDKPTHRPYESKVVCILTKLGQEYVDYAFYKYPTYKLYGHTEINQDQKDRHKGTDELVLEIGSIIALDSFLIFGAVMMKMSFVLMLILLPIPDISILLWYEDNNLIKHQLLRATAVPNPKHPHSFGLAYPVNSKIVPKSFPEQGMILFCISNQLHMLTGPHVDSKDVEHLLDMRLNESATKLDDLWHLIKQYQGNTTELDLLNFLKQHHIRLLNNLRNINIYDKMFDSVKNDDL